MKNTENLTKREHFSLEILKELIKEMPEYGTPQIYTVERAIKLADMLINKLEDPEYKGDDNLKSRF